MTFKVLLHCKIYAGVEVLIDAENVSEAEQLAQVEVHKENFKIVEYTNIETLETVETTLVPEPGYHTTSALS